MNQPIRNVEIPALSWKRVVKAIKRITHVPLIFYVCCGREEMSVVKLLS